jgi:head-tail adaptor
MRAMIGTMREQLVVQTSAPLARSVSSLTRSATTATVTTAAAHGYATGDYVTIAGATPAGFNGKFPVTVTGSTTFTYAVSSGLSTPAAGTITATYASDAQGGRAETWRTVDTLWAELVPLRADEQLAVRSTTAQTDLRFRVRVRADVTPKMRALWTPGWPAGAAQQTLEIHGVLPIDGGTRFMFLECGRAS